MLQHSTRTGEVSALNTLAAKRLACVEQHSTVHYALLMCETVCLGAQVKS